MCYVPLKLAIVVRLASSLHTRPRLLNILRFNSVFAFFVVAFFGSLVSTSNATGMKPTVTNSLMKLQRSCNISDFQFPPNEKFAHIILKPLSSLSAVNALTITFRVKLKEITNFPRVLSYAKSDHTVNFGVEIPGKGLSGRAADSHQELKNGTSAREAGLLAHRGTGYYIIINGQFYGITHKHQPLNVWNRVTMTWSEKLMQYAIYVDGISIVGPKKDKQLKDKYLERGGTLFMGQSNRLNTDSRFSGRIMKLQMWGIEFTPKEVKDLPVIPPRATAQILLDDPPTYGSILKNGSTCDAECQPGSHELSHRGSNYTILCKNCPKGKFSNTIGSIICTPCPAGQFNPDVNQIKCRKCPIGKYQSNSGQSNCIECADNYYCNKPGCSNCQPCGPDLPPLSKPIIFQQCLNGKLHTLRDKGIINKNKIAANHVDIDTNSGVISSNGKKIATNNRGIISNGDHIGTNKNKISDHEHNIEDLQANKLDASKQIRCETGIISCEGVNSWNHRFQSPAIPVLYLSRFNSNPRLILALQTLDTTQFFNVLENNKPRPDPNQIQNYLGTTGKVFYESADQNGFTGYCHCSNYGHNMTVVGTWMACGN